MLDGMRNTGVYDSETDATDTKRWVSL